MDDFFKTSQKFIYRKGEVILREGDIPSGVYYIEEGFIKVYSLNFDGSENLHVILKSGEIFPRNWIFDRDVENVSFEAITPVMLRRKTKESFIDLLNSDEEVMREVFRLCLDIIDILIDRIENLELTTSYPRVINRLLQLSKRYGERKGNEVRFAAPITHANLANSINMSRETASRELERLKAKNIISEENKIIFIKNILQLENELETYLTNR